MYSGRGGKIYLDSLEVLTGRLIVRLLCDDVKAQFYTSGLLCLALRSRQLKIEMIISEQRNYRDR